MARNAPVPDEALFTAWRDQGEREALGALLARCTPFVYRLALRLTGDAALAEDAVSESFVKVMAAAAQFRQGARFRSWLAGIAMNTALTLVRAERRRHAREELAATHGAPSRAAADAPRLVAARAAVAALGGLPPELRAPVVLCCCEGLSRSEAAAALGVPERTVSDRVARGLEKLRRALAAAGLSALALPALGAALGSAPAAEVPAALAAKVGALAGGAKTAGAAAGAGAALAAKGGIAMKAIAGILAAGAVAGAVAVSTGLGGGAGEPAPVNPYNGMQEREEVYEFTQKPSAKKEGDKWGISFASKAACDATVTILDKDGKIIRHLASGVLGANAPHPFQQNTLSQKLEWDGLTDDFKKAPAGCRARVSLGLKAEFERSIAYCPYDLPAWRMPYGKREDKFLIGNGPEGEMVILAVASAGAWQGRVYGKDGKYLRTFWPPPARDVEKMGELGYKFATTKWGDKTLVAYWFGPFVQGGAGGRVKSDPVKAISVLGRVADAKETPRPAALPASSLPQLGPKHSGDLANHLYNRKQVRMAADPFREEVHVMGLRFDGRTGKADESWFPKGGFDFSEAKIGPDGLLYIRIGGAVYGQWIVRVDPATGKAVPFTGNDAAPLPAKEWPDAPGKGFYCGGGWNWIRALKGQEVNSIWVGTRSHSVTHAGGFYVSPAGMLAAPIRQPDCGWGKKRGLPADWPSKPSQLGAEWPIFNLATVGVWDKEGNFLTANAVGGNIGVAASHGIAMDRDGNLYVTFGGCMPAGQKCLDGITDVRVRNRTWGAFGTVVKFRGQGGKYPLGRTYSKVTKDQAPEGAMKLDGAVNGAEGALWAYGGMVGQSTGDCTCCNDRSDMDYYARYWIISNQLYSVTVLDSNGNRVARLGRYGNVDDTEEDVKAGKDGLRFAWMRALAVSDRSLYVCDTSSRRILQASIKYASEETVNLDGSSASSAPAPASSPAARTKEAKAAALAKQDTPAPAAAAPSGAGSGPDPAVVCRGWWSLAMSYKRAGRADKAREYLRRIVETYPGNEYAARARRELARL